MTFKKARSFFSADGMAVLAVVVLCAALWHVTYPLKVKWPGLPPGANKLEALAYGYGDKQLAYRNIGMMLQNAGDTGGNITNLQDYDYKNIQDWLWVTYDLDPRANYVPSLAAFYFGGVKGADRLRYLVEYLARVGKDGGTERWRWLAHGVYLARFQMKDQELALQLANELAGLNDPDMPIWTKQMPAFVMTKVGKKKAARDLMLTIMATDKNMDVAEIRQTCWYVNKHLRESDDNLMKNDIYRQFCKRRWVKQDAAEDALPGMQPESK